MLLRPQEEVFSEELMATYITPDRVWVSVSPHARMRGDFLLQRSCLPQVHFHLQQETSGGEHHTIFPRSISQLRASVPFSHLQLHLTHGRWVG